MVKPVFSTGFDVPEEDDYLFMTDTIEFLKDDRGYSVRVRDVIQDSINYGSENNGMVVFDNFPLYREFGVARFLGFLIKSISLPNKDYPNNYFDDEKIQKKVEKELKGRLFGGRIRHVPGRREGVVMANIQEYYTKDEFREKKTAAGKEAPAPGAEAPKEKEKEFEW